MQIRFAKIILTCLLTAVLVTLPASVALAAPPAPAGPADGQAGSPWAWFADSLLDLAGELLALSPVWPGRGDLPMEPTLDPTGDDGGQEVGLRSISGEEGVKMDPDS